MFPGANARIYYNDAGEPTGWDYPPDPDPYAIYDAAQAAWQKQYRQRKAAK